MTMTKEVFQCSGVENGCAMNKLNARLQELQAEGKQATHNTAGSCTASGPNVPCEARYEITSIETTGE